jgi:hypothetical protein
MTQELEAAPPSGRDALMTTELVPEQILPKVLGTFGLTATYVFIICWVTGSSVMAAGGWTAIPMWVLGIVTFLMPAALAVLELGNLWPGQGGVYIWAFRTMGDRMACEASRQSTDHECHVRCLLRSYVDDLRLRRHLRGRPRIGHAIQCARRVDS